jgi:hypothetical protein
MVLAGCLLVSAGAVRAESEPAPRDAPAATRSPERLERARIQHLDGSGRATVVDIDPGVPGAKAFMNAPPARIPRPGEVILPPKSSPAPPAAD